jgi:3-mercaptopyruvate sulfurtransferase SseA
MAGFANPNVVVETEWVAAHLSDSPIRIVEVSVDPAAFQQGHIPEAVNIPWGEAVAPNGTFKSADELRTMHHPSCCRTCMGVW